jgi:cation transport ATPase
MKFARVTTIILWVILAISFFLIISLLANLDPNAADPDMSKWIGANLSWSYVLIGIATAAALILEFINTLSDKKAAKNSLIGIGLLGAVILVSYLLSDTKMPQFFGAEKFVENGTVTPTILLWIGTGLIASYILFGISVITILWSSISNFFK